MLETPSISFIDRWLRKAEKAVGVITTLLSIAAFGIGLLLGDRVTALVCSFIVFGIVGALEMMQVQAKKELKIRAAERSRDSLFEDLREANPTWKPKLIKEFKHNGLVFRSIGFEQLPISLCLTLPLCPKCQSSLAQRTTVLFPGIIRIRLLCSCGHSLTSSLTRAELIQEAEELANLPQ